MPTRLYTWLPWGSLIFSCASLLELVGTDDVFKFVVNPAHRFLGGSLLESGELLLQSRKLGLQARGLRVCLLADEARKYSPIFCNA